MAIGKVYARIKARYSKFYDCIGEVEGLSERGWFTVQLHEVGCVSFDESEIEPCTEQDYNDYCKDLKN